MILQRIVDVIVTPETISGLILFGLVFTWAVLARGEEIMRIGATGGLYESFLTIDCTVSLDGVRQPGTVTLADEEGGFIERVCGYSVDGPVFETVFGEVCVTPTQSYDHAASYRVEHDIWIGVELRQPVTWTREYFTTHFYFFAGATLFDLIVLPC